VIDQPVQLTSAKSPGKRLPSHVLPGPGALWAVMLLGLVLRAYGLLAQSLWLDEAMSLYWASLPAGEVLARLMALSGDPHPPLYYLLLKAWIAALGDGEIAVKALSVAAGLALIPLTYGLGQRLFGRRTGLLAALLASSSPLLVWYAQEVRMYSLLAALTLAAALCLWQALDTRRGLWWPLYALVALAGAYTHVYGALLLPFHGLFALWAWRRGWRGAGFSSILAGLLAFATLSILYAPWAWAAWQSSASACWPPSPSTGPSCPALFWSLWVRWSLLDWQRVAVKTMRLQTARRTDLTALPRLMPGSSWVSICCCPWPW
jgi:uncharacterized membrane protein